MSGYSRRVSASGAISASILDLYRLCADHRPVTWVVGFDALRETLQARDAVGFYFVTPPGLREETRLLGLPLRFDPNLPVDRIELHDRDGRVLGVIALSDSTEESVNAPPT